MKVYLFTTAFLLITNTIYSQEGRAFMLGLNPSITVEQFYEQGELDINIFPAVIQLSLNNRIDLRFITLFNVGIRKDVSGFANIGIETALPVYFKKKESLSKPSKGFYTAPVLSIAGNKLDQNTHIGVWLEPGYHLSISESFSMVFGVQAGATYIDYKSGEDIFAGHFGLKVILGWWM